MDKDTRAFMARIEAFCIEHDMPVTTFGRLALGDFAFVSRLRAGRSPSLRTFGKVRDFMDGYNKPKRRKAKVRPLAGVAA